jgi:hypothetical protein
MYVLVTESALLHHTDCSASRAHSHSLSHTHSHTHTHSLSLSLCVQINDRSLLGDRDSEIAVCVRGDETIKTTCNGDTITVSKFVFSLRMSLMNEHAGLPLDDLETLADPFSPSFATHWHQVAVDVWRCVVVCIDY